MIIVIGGTKGGTGKTTISTNMSAALAYSGYSVILVDADPQLSSRNWVDRRNTFNLDLPKIEGAMAKEEDLHQALKILESKHQNVIVDVGGFDSRAFRSASVKADIILLPIQPSQLDLESLPKIEEIYKFASDFNQKLKVLAIVSKVSPNRSVSDSEVSDTRAVVKSFEFVTLLDSMIYDRKIYREVIRDGRGVIDSKDDRAADEVSKLIQEVYSYVQ